MYFVMKKLFLCFLFLLPLAVTSCGDDEPGSELNGTWTGSVWELDYLVPLTFTFSGSNITVTYDDEVYVGNFEISNEGDSKTIMMYTKYVNKYEYNWKFKYTISGKELTLTPLNDEAIDYFETSIVLKRK